MPKSKANVRAPLIEWIFPTGGICAAVALAWALGSLQGHQSERRQHRPSAYLGSAKLVASRTCNEATPRAMFDCVAGKYETADERQREEQALTAQQQAAWSAMLSTLLSLFGVIATISGLIWVKGTLDATRDSAEAARGAVEETRRIGEAQVRAYIRISAVWVKLDDHGFLWFVPNVANSGQSPASNIKTRYHVTILHIPTSEQIEEIGEWNDWGEAIPPGGEDHELTSWHCPHRLNEILVDAWGDRGKVAIFVRLDMTADDVFGKNLVSVARVTGLPNEWLTGDFYKLGPTSVANSAVSGELSRRGAAAQ